MACPESEISQVRRRPKTIARPLIKNGSDAPSTSSAAGYAGLAAACLTRHVRKLEGEAPDADQIPVAQIRFVHRLTIYYGVSPAGQVDDVKSRTAVDDKGMRLADGCGNQMKVSPRWRAPIIVKGRDSVIPGLPRCFPCGRSIGVAGAGARELCEAAEDTDNLEPGLTGIGEGTNRRLGDTSRPWVSFVATSGIKTAC